MNCAARLLCLLLLTTLLTGCASKAQTEKSATAPESSGAAVDFREAVLTRQALSKIKPLDESPDDASIDNPGWI